MEQPGCASALRRDQNKRCCLGTNPHPTPKKHTHTHTKIQPKKEKLPDPFIFFFCQTEPVWRLPDPGWRGFTSVSLSVPKVSGQTSLLADRGL